MFQMCFITNKNTNVVFSVIKQYLQFIYSGCIYTVYVNTFEEVWNFFITSFI